MPEKKNKEQAIHSSAAEYLTYITHQKQDQIKNLLV